MYETKQKILPKRGINVIRILMSLYPSQYRKQYSREILLIFQDLYREECIKKGRVGYRFWIIQFGDITKSVLEQHKYIIEKHGMKKYIYNTIPINKYNIVGVILLLPFSMVFLTDILGRIIQGNVIMPNQSLMKVLYHTPLYSFPVLFTWVLLFPLAAVVINFIPLVKQFRKRPAKLLSATFIKQNSISILLLGLGLTFIAFLYLHDFAPCLINGLLSKGLLHLIPLFQKCQQA